MISYTGNGGAFQFFVSGVSSGVDSSVRWLPLLRLTRSQSVSMFGSVDITAPSPEIRLASNNSTAPGAGIRGNNNMSLIAYAGAAVSEEITIGARGATTDNRSLSINAGGREQIRISSSGNVILGNALTPASSQLLSNMDINMNGKSLIMQGSDGFKIKYDNNFFGANADAVVLEKTDVNGDFPDGGIAFVNSGMNGTMIPSMVIKGNGDIGIGTISPTAKLAVNGSIKATSVRVMGDIALPDYVFRNDYKLREIKAVEDFIKQNGHLPEVPSAKEVNENGMELGARNAVLLKKIEELTLYIIQQEKRIEALETMVEKKNNDEKVLR